MKIGLMHVGCDSRADPAIVAKRAEELKFESYCAGDHTVVPVESSVDYPGTKDGTIPDYLWQQPDPLIALACAGATTSKIKLGTAICLVPERNPLLTAKQVATLDDASGGRFLFGIGGGWSPEESTILGGDFEHRWSQAKDFIAAMKVLWKGRGLRVSRPLRQFSARAMLSQTREQTISADTHREHQQSART